MFDNDHERIRIVAISGSLRSGSLNRKALQIAERFAEEAGAEVQEIDLRDYSLPIYDGDIEAQGLPQPVLELKSIIGQADMLLIATPEYNYSVPAGLKNMIDWVTRGGNSVAGKVAAVFGVSNGLFGTIRMQPHLRQILGALDVFILPQPQVLIRSGREAFTADGHQFVDPKVADQLRSLVNKSIKFAQALKEGYFETKNVAVHNN